MIESLKTSRDPGAMNEYLSKIVAVGPRSPAARQDAGAGLIAWLAETRTTKNRLRRPVRKIWEHIGKSGKAIVFGCFWRIRHNP